MKRRKFLTHIGGAAAAWPFAAREQQPAKPMVGFMSGRSPEDSAHVVSAFRQGLAETGFVEGQTVTIESRCSSISPKGTGCRYTGTVFPKVCRHLICGS